MSAGTETTVSVVRSTSRSARTPLTVSSIEYPDGRKAHFEPRSSLRPLRQAARPARLWSDITEPQHRTTGESGQDHLIPPSATSCAPCSMASGWSRTKLMIRPSMPDSSSSQDHPPERGDARQHLDIIDLDKLDRRRLEIAPAPHGLPRRGWRRCRASRRSRRPYLHF